MMLTNEWLRRAPWFHDRYTRRAALCKSGLLLSIQASSQHRATPGPDGFTSVEVGFPTKNGKPVRARTLGPYRARRCAKVYDYVPVEVLDRMLRRNGGIVSCW